MGKSRSKNNFVLQASILAAAGIITRIIGLLYKSPLIAVIKDEGNGYFIAAHNVYSMILLISSYSIPSAMSKVIAQKLAAREYRNAHRLFKCAIWYVLLIGSIASLILFFGANYIVEGPAVIVLQVFTPTIFLYGLLGVLRGYFQAHSSMVQTSVSQILEQIANALVSIGAAYFLIQVTMGSLEMWEDPAKNTTRAMYGAIGSAMGTGAGVLVGLLFMLGVYGLNKKMIHTRIKRDRTRTVDSYRQISRTIGAVVTPFILSTAAYNANGFINSTLYLKIMQYYKKIEGSVAYSENGIFAGKVLIIVNIPVAFASAMASAMIPSITQLMAKEDYEDAKHKIGIATKATMLIAIPSAIGICVLAKPIITLLFNQPESLDIAAKLLMAVSVSVIFFSLSTLSSSILQGLGKVNIPIINAVIALVLQTGVLASLLIFTDLKQYALVITNIVYSGTICILNQLAVRKAIGYRQEVVHTFMIPMLSSAIMGGLVWAVYEGVHMLCNSNLVSLAVSIPCGGFIYFVLMIALRGLTKQELKSLPKGHMIIHIAQKFGLLK